MHPWTAQHEIGLADARIVIEQQFPDLAPARLSYLGTGWDNIAFLVNDQFVFRFPRHAVGVELAQYERAAMPHIAPLMPCAVPEPVYFGEPGDLFAHPFLGTRCVPGTEAHLLGLDRVARGRLASDLGRFAAAIRRIDVPRARSWGLRGDAFRRGDAVYRAEKAGSKCDALMEAGILTDDRALRSVLDRAGEAQASGLVVAHGDLDARHVMVGSDGLLSGIIDFGDVHIGDEATDISIAFSLLPPESRDAFFEHLPGMTESVCLSARIRAIDAALLELDYAIINGHASLEAEARVMMEMVTA